MHAGFVAVVDDIYVTRDRLDLFVANATTRPVHLVVLAPSAETVVARDAARPDTTVAGRWIHLDAVQREELAGVGLWIDSTGMSVDETVAAARIASRRRDRRLPRSGQATRRVPTSTKVAATSAGRAIGATAVT